MVNNGGEDKRQTEGETKAWFFFSTLLIQQIHHFWMSPVRRFVEHKCRHARSCAIPTASVRPRACVLCLRVTQEQEQQQTRSFLTPKQPHADGGVFTQRS